MSVGSCLAVISGHQLHFLLQITQDIDIEHLLICEKITKSCVIDKLFINYGYWNVI